MSDQPGSGERSDATATTAAAAPTTVTAETTTTSAAVHDGTPAGRPVADPLRTLALKPYVVEAICTVFDPEIPVNIYELGLIYDITVDARSIVHVDMTLTSPACPSAQQLPVEVADKVRAIDGVADAIVTIVWEPTWTMDHMSDAARLQLGL